MQPRKRLSDIVAGEGRDALASAWETTAAAADLGPVPAGEYLTRLLSGELFTARTKGTLGYKWTLEIVDGEHAGRRLWHDLWLTPAALPQAKRDLAKIGIVRLDQTEQPLPPGILLRVKVALRKGEDGSPYNRLTRIEAAGVEPADPYAPGDATEVGDDLGGGAVPAAPADDPTAFPFGLNAPELAPSTTPADTPPARPAPATAAGNVEGAPTAPAPTSDGAGGALPGMPALPARGRGSKRAQAVEVNGEAGPYAEGR